MLLAIDVGNTNTVLGLYKLQPDSTSEAQPAQPEAAKPLLAHWRITTQRIQTADEYGMLILSLFAMQDYKAAQVSSVIISSVVPPLDTTLRRVSERYFKLKPLFVEPGIRTGMPLLIDNPSELGADRVANGVAAFARYGGPCVVVDFGTATTFDVITAKGEYAGGVIAPGLGISADALFSRAARLARVDIRKPDKVIGTNTRVNLQSGIYYGYIGLVDGILERILDELGGGAGGSAEAGSQASRSPGRKLQDSKAPVIKIIATGGLAKLIVADSKYITEIDHMLTLDGLRIIYERNQSQGPSRGRKRVPTQPAAS
ncbi:MAG TPA: type III pantothenate kinase [Acidisarcina sp.]